MPRTPCPTCGETKDNRAFQCASCHTKFNPPRRGTGAARHKCGPGYLAVMRDGKEVLEHRAVMAGYIGRELLSTEHVHHINGDKHDNDISNLQLMEASEHNREHMLDGRAKAMTYLGHHARWGFQNS